MLLTLLAALALPPQVFVAQRLGYMNVFYKKNPNMHYSLRMFRADEHEVAWQLFNIAVNNTSGTPCFNDFHLDGVPKRVNEARGGLCAWAAAAWALVDGLGCAPNGSRAPLTLARSLHSDSAWPLLPPCRVKACGRSCVATPPRAPCRRPRAHLTSLGALQALGARPRSERLAAKAAWRGLLRVLPSSKW